MNAWNLKHCYLLHSLLWRILEARLGDPVQLDLQTLLVLPGKDTPRTHREEEQSSHPVKTAHPKQTDWARPAVSLCFFALFVLDIGF